MSALLTPESVFRAVNSIFTSMLGLELHPGNGHVALAPGEVKITASVGMAGDWNGTAILECSAETAYVLAAAMLSVPFEEIDDDVKDVMGEIANMFAGNVARLVPGSAALSPPCVVEGSSYSMDILKARDAVKLPLECQGRGLVVSVVEGSGG